MRIVISGQTPAKKNRRNLFIRNGRIVNLPNKIHQDWEQNALVDIASQVKGQADGAVIVSCKFYNKDKRGRDLDNQLSSILDILVKAGLIISDNCFVVEEVHATFGGVDKENPRAEVTIENI